MGGSDDTPAKLSRAAAARVIREIAADPDNIVPVRHAKLRMKQRRISITQVRRVVRGGYLAGDPWRDEHGFWRVDVRGWSAGEELTVGLAIEWRARLLIITVF